VRLEQDKPNHRPGDEIIAIIETSDDETRWYVVAEPDDFVSENFSPRDVLVTVSDRMEAD
jgi:hypothetical protein